MDLAYNHFQEHINQLKKRELKMMHTAANSDDRSGSISEVSALGIPVGGILTWRELEAEI